MLLRESLKRELDSLDESQLSRIATFIHVMITPNTNRTKSVVLWQNASKAERARDLRTWATDLRDTGVSLPNEAFDRESIYK